MRHSDFALQSIGRAAVSYDVMMARSNPTTMTHSSRSKTVIRELIVKKKYVTGS